MQPHYFDLIIFSSFSFEAPSPSSSFFPEAFFPFPNMLSKLLEYFELAPQPDSAGLNAILFYREQIFGCIIAVRTNTGSNMNVREAYR